MKVQFSNLYSVINNIDLFICSSGFETRSKSFPLALDVDRVKNGFIFHIDENYTVSYENLKELENRMPYLKTIQHPKNNPLETYDIILEKLTGFYKDQNPHEKLNIIIDITTFTREVLLILLKALNNEWYLNRSNIQLVYTPAENYPCEWLTRGIRYIRSIFGYSGMILPSKKLMLVILNGFENERTEEIINSFEPNAILLGRPSYEESINEQLSNRGKANFDEIKQKYQSNIIGEFEFSCMEIEKTIKVVENLIKTHGEEYNIILSPLNNKISTIAVAFVALKNENIQICYASANQYNINEYSTPSDYFLFFDMNSFLT
ncbi:hypothetical protein NK356_09545 [Chryseobacterium sp. S0630]|uniref:hypothetical protein n=1 Tax=Chryseobacterium sp. S0630 TaxID=2957803 RepID=UPI0020A0C9EF|nr:hypothetical protein [Chryseobacterium sp. S0630]MCP1299409.1 hypothetical protein [Chryseobacterium sp. S0630]